MSCKTVVAGWLGIDDNLLQRTWMRTERIHILEETKLINEQRN